MKKRSLVFLAAPVSALAVLTTPALAATGYSDVSQGSAFYDYVTKMAEVC